MLQGGLPSDEDRDAAPPAPADAAIEWRVHLARRQPRQVPRVLLVLAGAAAVAYAVFGHLLPVVVTMVALFAAVSEFLLPITYRLTPEGAARHNGLARTFLAWPDVRRCLPGAGAVKLSPLPSASRLDPWRGITLYLPADEALRSRIVAAVREHCPQADLSSLHHTDE